MEPKVIAVVDDEESVRSATSSLLRSIGYSCTSFSSAVALVDHGFGGVDCICSDIQMPDMSGLQLAAVLASAPASPPLVLMTAYADEYVATTAQELGVTALLEKPLRADLLVDAIEAALASRT